MCFVIKKTKTLVGRRGSDLEQAHREQKGHTKLHRQTGTTHSLNASHFQALLAQLTCFIPLSFIHSTELPNCSPSKFHSLFPSEHISHLFPGKACAASLLCHSTKNISPSSIPQTGFSTTRKVPAKEGSRSPASPPSNLTITAISIWVIYRPVQ